MYQASASAGPSDNGSGSDTIRVGVLEDCPPYNSFSRQNQLIGMNIDLIREMARRANKQVVLKPVSYNRLMMGLLYHQYDVVAAPQSVNTYRKHWVHYLSPYYHSADVIVIHPRVLSGARYETRSLEDVRRQRLTIGVYNGTSYPQFLKEQGLAAQTKIYPTQREMMLAFLNEKVDVMLTDRAIAGYYQQSEHLPFQLAPVPARPHKIMAFSLRKEDKALAELLEAQLDAMREDGTLHKIEGKWLNPHVLGGAA